MRHKSKSTTSWLYQDYRLLGSAPSLPVVGSASLVRDGAVIHSPGVEPLELPTKKSSHPRETIIKYNQATCFCNIHTDPPSGSWTS